jgi:hypothetical protein
MLILVTEPQLQISASAQLCWHRSSQMLLVMLVLGSYTSRSSFPPLVPAELSFLKALSHPLQGCSLAVTLFHRLGTLPGLQQELVVGAIRPPAVPTLQIQAA